MFLVLKKKALKSVKKFFLSVCPATGIWVYMGVSSRWIVAESQRLVFMQSNSVRWFVLHLQILKRRSGQRLRCVVASFMSCLMSPFFVLFDCA